MPTVYPVRLQGDRLGHGDLTNYAWRIAFYLAADSFGRTQAEQNTCQPARGRKPMERVLELTCAGLDGRLAERVAVIYVTVPEEARRLAEEARAAFPCPPGDRHCRADAGALCAWGPGMIGLVAVGGRNG